MAVRRERQDLDPVKGQTSDEWAYSVTSCALGEHTDQEIMDIIRGHWSAIENGVHHRRDVTFREDACRLANRTVAHALVILRNLAIGLYELEKYRLRTTADSCASWRRQMTFTVARRLLKK